MRHCTIKAFHYSPESVKSLNATVLTYSSFTVQIRPISGRTEIQFEAIIEPRVTVFGELAPDKGLTLLEKSFDYVSTEGIAQTSETPSPGGWEWGAKK